jgi:hypothetical protein
MWRDDKRVRKQAIWTIGFLVLQYALGIATNLYVKFPDGVKEGQAWEFAWKQVLLAAHIILGILLFVGAVALAVRAYRNKDKVWIRASGVYLLAIFLAGFAGSSFVSKQIEVYSLIMALSFIAAILSLVWGIVNSKK